MASQIPATTQGWELHGIGKGLGWDTLTWNPAQKLGKVGPTDVLVKFHAAALNYRDISSQYHTYSRFTSHYFAYFSADSDS